MARTTAESLEEQYATFVRQQRAGTMGTGFDGQSTVDEQQKASISEPGML